MRSLRYFAVDTDTCGRPKFVVVDPSQGDNPPMQDLLTITLNVPQVLKDGVLASLPLISEITDLELRGQVVEAWALSLALNGYTRIEELPGSGMPEAPVKGDQTHHLLGVAYIALGIKESLEKVFGVEMSVDRDTLIAAALCHDIGKTYEYNPSNRERWEADSRISGKPAIRHPAYGAYIALVAGLPERIAHVCACHSPEGRFVERSLAATIVHHADDSYWFVTETAENWHGMIPRL